MPGLGFPSSTEPWVVSSWSGETAAGRPGPEGVDGVAGHGPSELSDSRARRRFLSGVTKSGKKEITGNIIQSK